ncbi:MAG: FtsQ-type POTRA domain-containing protein, partial [Clostridia bacterium]|nr:FtsQ-type POTRA domain-containing protein [Clostridia bacterium]
MNKRLIIIFVCLALFVLTLVVGAVVFTVNDVDILLNSQENVAFDKAKILNISGIKKGQSVFTINSDKASANIEKQFPELKVIKIERSFPNKVRIHLDTRKAILKMKISNSDSYAVLDRELKIINIVNNDSEMYG